MRRWWLLLAGLLLVGGFSAGFALARDGGGTNSTSLHAPTMVERRATVSTPPRLRRVRVPALRREPRAEVAAVAPPPRPVRRRATRSRPRRAAPTPAPVAAPPAPAPAPKPAPNKGKKFFDSQ
jgi:hypothetical protein